MNPDMLLAHFDCLCEAPGASPRLRRFILDLAVQGKPSTRWIWYCVMRQLFIQ